MKAIRYLGYAALGVAALGLVACTTPKSKEVAGAYQQQNDAGAESYALKENSGYTDQERRNQYGEIINSLKAPSSQTYYFSFDENVVRSSDYKAIQIQASYLAAHPNAKIRLEGNADNRGSREYNIGLGWRRDQAVAKILEQNGVLPSQIDMVSYGKERPAVVGNNEDAWRLNRRVNLIYEAY
ncbi:MAG: peptidoglycan-binding protein [Coxiella sp. RIFCSPHIGHO2_12_FULL_42_15]|nr:MAG: peptidoglycan-binding protein [Coxiella sp. RIFCSPHIGHO2_12_FULL_42_15]